MLDHVGDLPRVRNDALVGALRAEVVELGEHLICRTQVERRLAIRVVVSVRLLNHGAVDGILGIEEVHVTGRDQHFIQFSRECIDLAVDVPEILVRLHRKTLIEFQKVVVVDGLDLKEVIELRNLLQFLVGPPRDNAANELARLARRADDDARAVLLQDGTRDTRTAALLRSAKVADVREGDEAVEVIQARLVLREEDNVVGTPILWFVEEVALHPVDDLDVRAFFLQSTRGVHCLGKRLHHAVIGDSDGGPAPARSGLDEYLRRNNGIERTHLCMCVQLDTLDLCRVLTLWNAPLLHAVDKENVVTDEFIVFDFPLDADGAALADYL